jgi:hypothetical protein
MGTGELEWIMIPVNGFLITYCIRAHHILQEYKSKKNSIHTSLFMMAEIRLPLHGPSAILQLPNSLTWHCLIVSEGGTLEALITITANYEKTRK